MTPPIDDDDPNLLRGIACGLGVLAGCAALAIVSAFGVAAALVALARWIVS